MLGLPTAQLSSAALADSEQKGIDRSDELYLTVPLHENQNTPH
jgi:hypothetical protein